MAINRFSQTPTRRTLASAPLVPHTAFNVSMANQAARVPRLANLHNSMSRPAAPAGRRR